MPHDERRTPTAHDEAVAERHVHECALETATSPSYAGAITVTELCDCGHALRSYIDYIL